MKHLADDQVGWVVDQVSVKVENLARAVRVAQHIAGDGSQGIVLADLVHRPPSGSRGGRAGTGGGPGFGRVVGVIVTEWVTNAFKYAYPHGAGEVRVKLKRLGDGQGELVVEDDGVGRVGDAPKGSGLGTRIVSAMARTIGAEIDYFPRRPGTSARLAFPCAAEG